MFCDFIWNDDSISQQTLFRLNFKYKIPSLLEVTVSSSKTPVPTSDTSLCHNLADNILS